AQQSRHLGGRAEREAWAKHRIARANPLRHQPEEQRIGAARARERVARTAECRKLGLKLANLGTEDELAVVDNAGDCRVDARPEAPSLRREIDEWNRGGRRVLVHHPAARRGSLRGRMSATR